jgi:Flp pilus assembly protein TadD
LLLAGYPTHAGASHPQAGCKGKHCEAPVSLAALPPKVLKQVQMGSVSLQAARYPEANQHLNLALNIDPENAQLHYLNAIAYHLGWRNGQTSNAQLAEAGYLTALGIDPNLPQAARQLGMLYAETKRFDAASAALAKAVLLDPSDVEAHLALSLSAYYAHKPFLASWAARRAYQLSQSKDDPAILQALAITSAASGDITTAERFRLDLVQIDPKLGERLRRRISRWDSVHESLGKVTAKKNVAFQFAQAEQAEEDRGESDTLLDNPPAYTGRSMAGSGPDSSDGPTERNWSDCQQAFSSASNMGGGFNSAPPPNLSNGSQNNNQIQQLTALPAPCKGMPLPRMAMVDVTLLRTAKTSVATNGVNLLDGLKVVLTGSKSWTKSSDPFLGSTSTLSGTLSLPSVGITYALNIANAAERRSDMILRPTLMSLDRQPSTFFTGYNINFLIEGGGYSGGSIQEKRIGMTVAVTPTFVDDDSMLLKVSAERTFTEPNISDGSVLTTSSNTVSTSVLINFDQTLVLSGFRASDKSSSTSGTPILKSIPVIQNLFKHSSKSSIDEEVLIVITPRRPKTLGQSISLSDPAARQDKDYPIGQEELMTLEAQTRSSEGIRSGTVEAILKSLQSHELYGEFKSGDLTLTPLKRKFSMGKVLEETWDNLLY